MKKCQNSSKTLCNLKLGNCTQSSIFVGIFVNVTLYFDFFRLQPISAEEGVQLGHLASLYSLRMDCDTTENRKREELQNYQDIDVTDPSGVLFPVLTKTPNTTQMDKLNDPSASSPFNAEGSSSSNVSGVSSVYTYSDIDSKTGDSKRIKK